MEVIELHRELILQFFHMEMITIQSEIHAPTHCQYARYKRGILEALLIG